MVWIVTVNKHYAVKWRGSIGDDRIVQKEKGQEEKTRCKTTASVAFKDRMRITDVASSK